MQALYLVALGFALLARTITGSHSPPPKAVHRRARRRPSMTLSVENLEARDVPTTWLTVGVPVTLHVDGNQNLQTVLMTSNAEEVFHPGSNSWTVYPAPAGWTQAEITSLEGGAAMQIVAYTTTGVYITNDVSRFQESFNNVGAYNTVRALNLDGVPAGNIQLVFDETTYSGPFGQGKSSTCKVVDALSNRLTSYNVATTDVSYVESLGGSGTELIYPAYNAFTVVNDGTRNATTYTGISNYSWEVANLRGVNSQILLLGYSTVWIIHPAAETMSTFQVTPFSSSAVLNLDGSSNSDVVLFEYGKFTVINDLTGRVTQENLLPYSGWTLENLGGSKGEDIIFFANGYDYYYSDLNQTLVSKRV